MRQAVLSSSGGFAAPSLTHSLKQSEDQIVVHIHTCIHVHVHTQKYSDEYMKTCILLNSQEKTVEAKDSPYMMILSSVALMSG